jgi:serine acetyltransferase
LHYVCLWTMDLSFWVLFWFRFFHAWRRSWLHIAIVRAFCEKLVELATHVHFPSSVEAGPGLHIYHGYGIVIHGLVRMGENVTLYHRVTLGQRFPKDGVPTIGNNVLIGAGACVLGPVVVPDNAVVPANAVITPSKLAVLRFKKSD